MIRMRRTVFTVLLLAGISFIAGCASGQPVAPSPTPTSPPPTATPTGAAPAPTATEPEPAASATATLSPARATAQALADAVTVPTKEATEATGEPASNDYVVIYEQAANIIEENYVRDIEDVVADWDAVRREYRQKVEEVETQEEFWQLMRAFVGEINDDHSRFVRPDQFNTEFQLQPPEELTARPSIGVEVWPPREAEHLRLWYVCETGPAAEAGLVRGDVITAINGEEVVADGGFDRALIQSVYAAEGSVTLTVQQGPDTEPREVTLEPGPVAGCDGWRAGLLSQDPRIGYIRIPNFAGNAATNIMQGIDQLEAEAPLDGLVLDVRHNPGGNADQSIAIFTTGVFGKTGPLRDDATQSIYRIRGPIKWNETTPMAVLTDGSSHSAAEYFATAIKQSGRATLVGQPTAGNTEGISGYSLPDGSLIRLAVMTLQLPDGSTLEETGVQPDISVPLGKWGLRQTPDVQLETAVKAVQQQIADSAGGQS